MKYWLFLFRSRYFISIKIPHVLNMEKHIRHLVQIRPITINFSKQCQVETLQGCDEVMKIIVVHRTHINKLLNNEDSHKVNENQHKFVIIGPLFMYESFHLSIWQMTQRYSCLIKLNHIMEGHNDS